MSDDVETIIDRLRPGDVVSVDKLAEIATTVRELRDRLEMIHAKGARVAEKTTGRTSDGKDGPAMALDAALELRKGLPTEVARANGQKGGRKKAVREMPKAEAKAIWFDTVNYATNDIAVAAMTGWSKPAANREWGKSGRKQRGRPKKQ